MSVGEKVQGMAETRRARSGKTEIIEFVENLINYSLGISVMLDTKVRWTSDIQLKIGEEPPCVTSPAYVSFGKPARRKDVGGLV